MDILKRPMFFAALTCCVAAAISLFVNLLAFVVIAIALIMLATAIFYKKYKYITVASAIVIFALSLYFQFNHIDNINRYDNQKIDGRFLVVSEPEAYENFNTVTLKVEGNSILPQNTKYFVFDYKQTELKMGNIVDATIKLSAIDRYDEYRLYDYSNGIYATASVVALEKSGDSNGFYKIAGNIRAYAKETVSSLFSGDTAGLLVALTTGDKTLLSDEFSENVKTTGISHIIVVSGMHLSIIMMAIFWCVDRMFYNKYIRSLLSVAAVVLISAVCGFTMSISRAGVMFVIAGLAPVFNRENDSLSSLLTAVTAVLIGAPFTIFNVSFQLSVLSTLAIIWAVPFYYRVITERFNISSKIVKTLLSTVLCSVFAIIFTLPVTIKIFGYVSIISPITNLVISYPVMIALILNIVVLIISVIPIVKILGELLLWIAGLCSRFIVLLINTLAELPVTVAVLPQSAFLWSLLVIAAVIGYMYYYEFKKKRSDLNANSV
ncbi:MAG: ComEC/Rec2 family competence protein [Clostridia bacterium]|nr:ComEC/Rec2 family competence protein [Clostridia bacterium]